MTQEIQEPRKATEVILDLEAKIETLLASIQTMDLNIKILSNKLNKIIEDLGKQSAVPSPPPAVIQAFQPPTNLTGFNPTFSRTSAADPARTVKIKSLDKLSEDAPTTDRAPIFSRTSRNEEPPDSYLKRGHTATSYQSITGAVKPPPGRGGNDIPVTTSDTPSAPRTASPAPQSASSQSVVTTLPPQFSDYNSGTRIIPVEQRIVDKMGKSVFLAKVKITDLDDRSVYEGETKGNGKWMAPLSVGTYKVTVTKFEKLSNQNVGTVQTLIIDGSQNPLKLPPVIIE